MTILEAILLGIVQGLTEFLPVSSSGHLELANYLFGIEEPNNVGFTMAVHLATVLSIFVVFWRELWRLVVGTLKFKMNEESIFVINIAISLTPIIFVGLFFKEQIEALFVSNLLLVGAMLLVTALLLTIAHFSKAGDKPITPKRAFIIGIAQAVAVLPGLSRSGSTISAGVMQGVNRKEVAKFSFLMVIVPIVVVNCWEVFKSDAMGVAVGGAQITAGFISAFITGTISCKWMVSLVSRGKLIWFALYCVVVGVASMTLYFW